MLFGLMNSLVTRIDFLRLKNSFILGLPCTHKVVLCRKLKGARQPRPKLLNLNYY